MKHKHVKTQIAIALSLGALAMDITAAEYNNLEDSWYLGGAIGLSNLEPITSSGFTVTDDKDVGKKIYAGVNITEQLGVEAFWNDLGEAEVSGASSIGSADYKALGINAIYKPPVKIGNIQPFGKLGAAKMTTKSSGNVLFTQENQFSLFGGAGVDVNINKNLAVRAEFEYFTEDVNQLSVGIKWAPRGHIEKNKPIPAALPYNFGVQPTKVITRVVTQPPPKVELLNKSLSGASSFASGSSVLSYIGKQHVDSLLYDIEKSQIKIHHVKIIGHTDNVGSARKNLQLSQQRAQSVADYLAQRGISRDSMTILGAGQNQPIANNRTADGRAQNRRVEIAVSGAKMLIK